MSELIRPLQQHPHFAACLRAARRDVLHLPGGLAIRRRIAGLTVSLASRASSELIDVPQLRSALRLITPDRTLPFGLKSAGYMPIFTPATVAEWDISPELPILRRRLSGKWRNQLRRAEEARMVITLTNAPTEADHWLYRTDQRNARTKGYRGMPQWVTTSWAQLHPRDTLMVETHKDGLPIAAMAFLRHGPVATYQIAYASDTARRLNAHRAMLWRAVRHFRNQGVTRLDLGTIETDHAPGLARFKLGTGASTRQLGGTWMAAPVLSEALRQFRFQWPFGQKA